MHGTKAILVAMLTRQACVSVWSFSRRKKKQNLPKMANTNSDIHGFEKWRHKALRQNEATNGGVLILSLNEQYTERVREREREREEWNKSAINIVWNSKQAMSRRDASVLNFFFHLGLNFFKCNLISFITWRRCYSVANVMLWKSYDHTCNNTLVRMRNVIDTELMKTIKYRF